MKTRPHIFAVSLTALTLGSVANGSSIAVNFVDSADTTWGAASAGAPGFAQENWNFMQTDWSGNGENDTPFANMVTSTGDAASELQGVSYEGNTDPVHFDAANTWRSGAGNGDANATLMNGYLDDGGNEQPYVNISLSPNVVSAQIVLYFNGDGQNGPVGRYWLEEWTDSLTEGTVITDQVGISSNSYTGTFVSAGEYNQTDNPGNVDVAEGNYLVFSNITANNIRIRGAGNGDPEDFGRGPLNGFQVITTIPEPTSAVLVLLGGFALVSRRRN